MLSKKYIKKLILERIKIKNVTKNPPGSENHVTIHAEISPILGN